MKYITKKDLALNKRRPDSHKGDNGRVLIIGGSKEYVGAPAIAGMAALRAGCDIAVIAAPEKVAWAVNTYSPDLITIKLRGDSFDMFHSRELEKVVERFDCVLIGNGMGQERETAKFVARMLKILVEMKKPIVIDADALKIIGSDEGKANKILEIMDNAILTPHKKEFELMSGVDLPISFEEKPMVLRNTLEKTEGDNVILLKGRIDIVASKKYFAYNNTGNEGMTIGGTGDVLAGIAASLAAQRNNLFTSACAAAYVNGLAGEYLFRKSGIGFTASDIAHNIPVFMRQIR